MTRKGSISSPNLVSYCQVVKKLFHSHAPNYMVAAAEFKVARSVKRDHMTES